MSFIPNETLPFTRGILNVLVPDNSNVPSKDFTSSDLVVGLEYIWENLILQSKKQGLKGQQFWVVQKAQ